MSFVRLVVVEMRRALHRRLVRWMVTLAVALCALTGIVAFLSSGDPVKLARADEHPARMVDWWTSGDGGFLNVAAIVLALGAAICGASVAGAEWRSGTVTTVLGWEPRRVRLHVARSLSGAVLAFVIAGALQALFLGSTVPAVLAHGSTSGTDGEWWLSLTMAAARIALISALIAVLAISVATIGRNTSAALIALAGWALAVERIVVGLRPSWARFMIGENVATVVPWAQIDDAAFDRPPIVALASLLGYFAAVALVATLSFARRDIASTGT